MRALEFSLSLVLKEGTGYRIHFQVQPESYYFPVLIDYRKDQNQVIVTIYKQLKLSPEKGIMYTPPPSQILLDFMHPQTEVNDRVYTFALENPVFVLNTPNGNTPILVQ